MTNQLALELPPRPDYGAERFIAGAANAEARAALALWRSWPKGAMALIGPAGSGKTHLAMIWVAETGAAIIPAASIGEHLSRLEPGRAVLVEDADRALDEDGLFHLLNRADAGDVAGVLLTARVSPGRWTAAIPDLVSRLAALHAAELREPDDDMLRRLLVKLFADLQAPLADGMIDYLLPRMERSVDAARRMAAEMDRQALARRTPVNRAVARRVLEQWTEDEETGP